MKRCLNCMEEYEDSRGICPQCCYREGEESGNPSVLRAGSILQGRYIVGTCRDIRDCHITYIGWDALFERKVLIEEFFPSRCMAREDGKNLTVKSGMEELCRESIDRYVHYHRNLIRLYREEDIISVFSCFKANQTAYATMQYSEALTLGQWIRQDGRLDERDALAFLYQAVQAVRKVHDLGLVHGDIRMDHFWMTGTGGLVLKGFAEPCHYCGNPEQTDYRNIGAWIDVYGLSRLFGEMLLGEEDSSDDDILDLLSNDSIKLPVRTIMAVKGGLGRTKDHRILSLDEFSDRIFGDSATMRLVNQADRSRRKGRYGAAEKRELSRQDLLAGVAVAAVIVVAAVFFTMGRLTGTLFAANGQSEETFRPGTAGNAGTPGNATPSDIRKGVESPNTETLDHDTSKTSTAAKPTAAKTEPESLKPTTAPSESPTVPATSGAASAGPDAAPTKSHMAPSKSGAASAGPATAPSKSGAAPVKPITAPSESPAPSETPTAAPMETSPIQESTAESMETADLAEVSPTASSEGNKDTTVVPVSGWQAENGASKDVAVGQAPAAPVEPVKTVKPDSQEGGALGMVMGILGGNE